MYDFQAILASLDEHPTDDLTYLSRHMPVNIVINHTFSRKPVYLVNEKQELLIERFTRLLTKKREAIVANILNRHPFPSDFQMPPWEIKNNESNRLISSL